MEKEIQTDQSVKTGLTIPVAVKGENGKEETGAGINITRDITTSAEEKDADDLAQEQDQENANIGIAQDPRDPEHRKNSDKIYNEKEEKALDDFPYYVDDEEA